jgi:hypothetical protein
MRKLAKVALLFFCLDSVARTEAYVYGRVTTVIDVNQNAHMFTVHWMIHRSRPSIYNSSSQEQTFKTSNHTIYTFASGKAASWANLIKGTPIKVLAGHMEGSDAVADNIQIVSGS